MTILKRGFPFSAIATENESFLSTLPVNERVAADVAEGAIAGAKPLSMNAYKIEIAKTLVRRAILQYQEC